jgi:alpha-D-xyloside xylohydrolase
LTPNWEGLEGRCREIIGWRMQLVPYLRAAFARYAADGTPPFRALALDWPDNPELAKTDDAWMVGDRMLVAPLFADEPGRRLTLPPGQWRSLWSGASFQGGETIDIPADTQNIPVFLMAGSVLPLASITNSTVDPESRNLEVRVFGDGHLPFSLHTSEADLLQLAWDAQTRAGTVVQHGNNSYKITSWKQI